MGPEGTNLFSTPYLGSISAPSSSGGGGGGGNGGKWRILWSWKQMGGGGWSEMGWQEWWSRPACSMVLWDWGVVDCVDDVISRRRKNGMRMRLIILWKYGGVVVEEREISIVNNL
ncbi:hypothetical protein BUALT_Bualt17G0078500 [Buddleja alternifolia]|uniref:Uncharacterized protein n=1 Tax=Buddleja alternifolia TaxID=168488 RepID=A0AAV6WD72_9LAMI|nr:hypothetical protein BUALT_Bualt17G0078500 [Buddleja alternifolia]